MSQGCVSANAALSQSVSYTRNVHFGVRSDRRNICGFGAGKAAQPLSEHIEGGCLMRKVQPSNVNPWDGTAVEGSPYTVEQARTMKRERPTWKKFRDRPVKIKWKAPGSNRVEAVTTVLCPIIAQTKTGLRVLVVTPAGHTLWIDAVPTEEKGAQ